MARLPQPGGDAGNWGDILNDYLSQIHQADGSLKDGSIPESALAPSVQSKVNTASPHVHDGGDITTGTVASGQLPDASAGAKGAVQLAGDLAGTAATPTVVVASETVAGKVELATTAETLAGIDTTRAVTSAGLKVVADTKAAVMNLQTFTVSGTWTNPSSTVARWCRVRGTTGGSGGGSGRRGAPGTVRTGGGGGAGGAPFEFWFLTTELAATVPVTVGAGGAGGVAVLTDDTDGSPGASGGATYFGVSSTVYGTGFSNNSTAGGRGGSTAAALGGTHGLGGPAGAASSTLGNAGMASSSPFLSSGYMQGCPASGGSGGGLTSGNVESAGGAGASIPYFLTGGTAGTAGGGSGGVGTSTPVAARARGGAGGGGGGSSVSAPGGGGGNGGTLGAGGGGGGASTNGFSSGAGGNGANGYLDVTVF